MVDDELSKAIARTRSNSLSDRTLARLKVPTHVVLVEQLPKNARGTAPKRPAARRPTSRTVHGRTGAQQRAVAWLAHGGGTGR